MSKEWWLLADGFYFRPPLVPYDWRRSRVRRKELAAADEGNAIFETVLRRDSYFLRREDWLCCLLAKGLGIVRYRQYGILKCVRKPWKALCKSDKSSGLISHRQCWCFRVLQAHGIKDSLLPVVHLVGHCTIAGMFVSIAFTFGIIITQTIHIIKMFFLAPLCRSNV